MTPERPASPDLRPRVWLGSLSAGYEAAFGAGLEWTGLVSRLRGARVFVKPNLTYPVYRPGVMTNPAAVEALLGILRDLGARIVVGEADSGGYNPFSMDGVFEKTGLRDMARRFGVGLVNLSHEPARNLQVRAGFRRLRVPIPRVVLEETDVFMTMPVPKIHMNTIVSMSVKNQWGIIQEPSIRLKLHPYFTRVIHAINKALPSPISIVDGQYGLNRTGPLRGDVERLGWAMVADNVFAADLVGCCLMRVPVRSVPHLRVILRAERLRDLERVAINTDPSQFAGPHFYLRREWTDYPGLVAFRSRAAAYVGYESPLAGLLHRLLYRFREPFY